MVLRIPSTALASSARFVAGIGSYFARVFATRKRLDG